MGILTDYFRAADEQEALRANDFPGGPLQGQPFQGLAAGCCEEERVCRWQATTSSAIKENRGVDALRKLAQWFGGSTPPDGGTSHNDRMLRFFQ